MNKLLIIIGLFNFLGVFAQDSISNKILDYQKTYPKEIVFVAIPNTHYIPGDKVPIKVFLRNPVTKTGSSESLTVYLSLINAEGKSVQNFSLYPVNGSLSTELPLNNDLEDGFYMLVGYTNYMKNQPKQTWFKTPLIISTQVLSLPQKDMLINVSVENNGLLDGTNNLIIIETFETFTKKPYPSLAYLIDDQNDTLKRIDTSKGFGGFMLNPTQDRSYHISCDQHVINLTRKEIQSGLRHNILGNNHLISVVHYDPKEKLKLIIVKDGIPIGSTLNVNNGFNLRLQRTGIEGGLYEALLLNDQNELIATRLFFEVKSVKSNYIQISKNQIESKESFEMSLSKAPEEAFLTITPKSNPTFVDFKKFVTLNYCLDRPIRNSEKYDLREMNYLLAARKQVLFEWDKILSNTPVNDHFKTEKSLVLKGYLLNKDKEVLKNHAFEIDGIYSLLNFKDSTDQNGYFETEYMSFVNQEVFTYSDKDESLIPDYVLTDFSYFSDHFDFVEYNSSTLERNVKLKEITKWFSKPVEKNIKDRRLYEKPDYQIDLRNYVSLTSLEEMIFEYVTAVKVVSKKGLKTKLKVVQGEEPATTEPLIMINHMPCKPESIWKLGPNDVDMIEVLYPQNDQIRYLGSYYTGGLISFFISDEKYEEINPEPLFKKSPFVTINNKGEIKRTELYEYAPILEQNLYIEFFPSIDEKIITTGDVIGEYQINLIGFDNNKPISESVDLKIMPLE